MRDERDEVAHLRAEAKRCRDLAQHIRIKATREILEHMAEDFETRAQRLERLELGGGFSSLAE
jgi:hypothetical protein